MSDIKININAQQLADITLGLVSACQRRQEMIADNAHLSWSEFKCLRAFQSNPVLSVKDIASRMSLTSSRLTRIIDGLVRKRYATRHIDPTDRRIINVTLTQQGAEIARKVSAECTGVYEKILGSIDPLEHEQLIHAVNDLYTELQKQTVLPEEES